MQTQRDISSLMKTLKEQLIKRGPLSIRNLGRTFRALDSYDGNRKVDRQEFAIGLRENGIILSPKEHNMLFDYFDLDKDGNICFDEFLVGIRGRPNDIRQEMIDKAFTKFDKDRNGFVDIVDLRGVFNAKFHPKVKSGRMTEAQAFSEFLASFNDRNRDGRITKDEWDEYYAAISASLDNDQHFVELMRTVWKMN